MDGFSTTKSSSEDKSSTTKRLRLKINTVLDQHFILTAYSTDSFGSNIMTYYNNIQDNKTMQHDIT